MRKYFALIVVALVAFPAVAFATDTVGVAVTAAGSAATTLMGQLGDLAVIAIPVGFVAFGLVYLVRRGKSLMR